MSTLHYYKKNQQFWCQYSSVPEWHQCLQCILQFVVQSLSLEFKFSQRLIHLVSCNMCDFFRAVEVVGSGRYRQFRMFGSFALSQLYIVY